MTKPLYGIESVPPPADNETVYCLMFREVGILISIHVTMTGANCAQILSGQIKQTKVVPMLRSKAEKLINSQ